MEIAITWDGDRAPLAKAFVAAQKATEAVKKASTNPAFRSKYADLAGVVEAVVPALNAAGVGVMQFPGYDGELVTVTTTFLHEGGSSVTSTLALRPSKQDPQGIGSAVTYGRRYSLLAMSGAAPEDDDGNAASGSRQVARAPLPTMGVEPEGWRDRPDFEGGGAPDAKTAHHARKDGDDKLFKQISAEIVTLESSAAIGAFMSGRKDAISKFPEGWRKQLREELEEQRTVVREREAREAASDFPGDRDASLAGRDADRVPA